MSHDPHADPDMLRRAAHLSATKVSGFVDMSNQLAVELGFATPDSQVCDVHYWQSVDRRDDVYRCRHCSLTWSLDDDPDGEAA